MLNLMNSAMLNWFITKWDGLYYKLGQVLQSEATLLQRRAGITNWVRSYYKVGKVIYYNVRQLFYKVGLVTKLGKNYYKVGQLHVITK